MRFFKADKYFFKFVDFFLFPLLFYFIFSVSEYFFVETSQLRDVTLFEASHKGEALQSNAPVVIITIRLTTLSGLLPHSLKTITNRGYVISDVLQLVRLAVSSVRVVVN